MGNYRIEVEQVSSKVRPRFGRDPDLHGDGDERQVGATEVVRSQEAYLVPLEALRAGSSGSPASIALLEYVR